MEQGTCSAPRCPTQGGRAQPHIPASAAPVSWRNRATPGRSASQDFWGPMCLPRMDPQILAQKLWRCAMPHDSRNVSETIPNEALGSLGGCLVEGDPEQRSRERHVRRRSLLISILTQAAVVALLILLPLFGRTEHLALSKTFTPIPPYGHPPHHAVGDTTRRTIQTVISDRTLRFFSPTAKPTSPATPGDSAGPPQIGSGG